MQTANHVRNEAVADIESLTSAQLLTWMCGLWELHADEMAEFRSGNGESPYIRHVETLVESLRTAAVAAIALNL